MSFPNSDRTPKLLFYRVILVAYLDPHAILPSYRLLALFHLFPFHIGLSLLELILITTMVKLHEIREGQPLNFEIVFHGGN